MIICLAAGSTTAPVQQSLQTSPFETHTYSSRASITVAQTHPLHPTVLNNSIYAPQPTSSANTLSNHQPPASASPSLGGTSSHPMFFDSSTAVQMTTTTFANATPHSYYLQQQGSSVIGKTGSPAAVVSQPPR